MTRHRLGSGAPGFDPDRALCALGDQLGKADAFLTAAEDLIERSWSGSGNESGAYDARVMRRRNHAEHLVEAAKLAVRKAAKTGRALEEFAKRWRGA